MTEYKFVELKSLKMDNSGPGRISGYRAVFDIDEGGDLLIKGAFRDTAESYLNSGFTAHSHLWNFADTVGYPLSAREDGHGWFVESEFHTTQTAQDVRTIAKERLKAGKTVGFSFGYSPKDYDYIDARDYERVLPRYVAPERLDYNLDQAKRFQKIRILKAVDVIEDSIVTAPMNKLAMATGVKFVRGGPSYSSATETLRLRSNSLRLRATAIQALYGSSEDRLDAIALRAKSERIRNGVLRSLCASRLAGLGK